MSDTVSAGTFVAAVLETAGYLSQSEILLNFSDFFERFGILLFVVACVGALTSIALFGSYKFGRLLIMGPALFYLMVGTFSNTQGAVWVAGGGMRAANGAPAGKQQAINSIRAVIAANKDQTNPGTASTFRNDIPVALPFRVFTSLIDNLMRTISDVILSSAISGGPYDRNQPGGLNSDLLFLTRTKALDSLLSSKMSDPELMKMFQADFLTSCSYMFEAATVSSMPFLSPRREQELITNANIAASPSYKQEFIAAAQRIRDARAYYTQQYATYAALDQNNRRVLAGEATRQFMIDHENAGAANLTPEQQLCAPGAHAVVRQIMNAYYPGQAVTNVPSITLTCNDMWMVVREAIRCNAANIQHRLQLTMTGSNNINTLTDNLCQALATKLNRPPGGSCDLVEATAVALFRNSILSTERSIFMSKVESGMEFIDTVPAGQIDPLIDDPELFTISPDAQIHYLTIPNPKGEGVIFNGRIEVDAIEKSTGKRVRLPASRIMSAIHGTKDAGFIGHQEYTTHGLRQKIYTAAVQFPYWQGVLLYLIAVAYPFFSVLLLVPSKAHAFLYIPLAWLWVKSWEVGLAVAIVFDRVLWNTLPTMDFEKSFNASNGKLLDQQLPTVISEAFKTDPAFNIHIYYYMMSMALFAIPTITGWIVLKAKSNVFNSIMSKPTQIANEAESLGSGEFGMLMMNHNMLKMAEVRGSAIWQLGRRGEGIEADGRGDTASRFATVAAGANAAGRMASNWRNVFGLSGAPAALAGMPMDYVNNYQKVLGAELGVATAVNTSYHKTLGRSGRYQMQLEAWMNAYDGGGGFEINFEDDMKAIVPAKLDAALLKVGMLSDAAGTVAGSGAVGANSVPWLGKVAQIETMRQLINNMFDVGSDGQSGLQQKYKELEDFLKTPAGREKIDREFTNIEEWWGSLWDSRPIKWPRTSTFLTGVNARRVRFQMSRLPQISRYEGNAIWDGCARPCHARRVLVEGLSKMFNLRKQNTSGGVGLLFASLVFLVQLAFVSDALAQTAGPPMVTSIGPSAGSLAAAMLETVGYRAQQIVLTDLGEFITQYAYLIWVLVAVTGIIMVAVYGKYDQAIWLMVGPGLLYFLLQNTVVSSGVEWRFGKDKKNLPSAFNLSTGNTNSRVSWAFERYNIFVSSIAQNLITVITDENSKGVLKRFMNRGRIFGDLMATQVTQGGLKGFLADALMQCNEEMDAARVLAAGYRDPSFRATTEYALAWETYTKTFAKPKKMLLNPAGKAFIIELFEAAQVNNGTFPGLKDMPNPMSLCTQKSWTRVQSVGGIKNAVELPISCEELWCWMGLGVQSEVARTAQRAQEEYGIDDVTFKRLLEDIALKLQTPHTILNNKNQIFQNAQVAVPDLSVIPVIIGGYLIRDLMNGSNTADSFGNLAQHAGVQREEYNFGLYNGKLSHDAITDSQFQDLVGKLIGEQIVEMKKYEIVTMSLIFPYIQGIILYVLALTFPFFCLAIIIPGKIDAIVTWMMIWAWAKSWDVGWAIVVILDDFLWQMMPHSAVYDPSRDPNHGPESVFAAAFNGDPAYSLSNYYIILAAMVLAVPMVSAQVMLGAKAGLVTPLVSGVAHWTSSFSSFIRDWVGAKQQGYFNWVREQYSAKYAIDQLKEVTAMSDSQVQSSTKLSNKVKEANATFVKQKAEIARGLQLLETGKIAEAEKALNGLGILNNAARMNVQYTKQQLQLEFLRAQKSALEQYNVNLGRVFLYESSNTEAFYNTERIRRVLSDRGEWWNNPSAPNELVGLLYRQRLGRTTRIEEATAFGAAATDPRSVGKTGKN